MDPKARLRGPPDAIIEGRDDLKGKVATATFGTGAWFRLIKGADFVAPAPPGDHVYSLGGLYEFAQGFGVIVKVGCRFADVFEDLCGVVAALDVNHSIAAGDLSPNAADIGLGDKPALDEEMDMDMPSGVLAEGHLDSIDATRPGAFEDPLVEEFLKGLSEVFDDLFG